MIDKQSCRCSPSTGMGTQGVTDAIGLRILLSGVCDVRWEKKDFEYLGKILSAASLFGLKDLEAYEAHRRLLSP